jgi:hypothetical protein
MWELEPGPIVREAMPLGPNVFTPGKIARHLDILVGELGTSDGAFASRQILIAGNTADGLDAEFAQTIDIVADIDGNHPAHDDDATAHQLGDAGAGAETYRQGVLQYLPQPDASISGDFISLPAPPMPEPGGDGGPGDPGPPPPAGVLNPPGWVAGALPTFAQVDWCYQYDLGRPASQFEFETYWANDPEYRIHIWSSYEAMKRRGEVT